MSLFFREISAPTSAFSGPTLILRLENIPFESCNKFVLQKYYLEKNGIKNEKFEIKNPGLCRKTIIF